MWRVQSIKVPKNNTIYDKSYFNGAKVQSTYLEIINSKKLVLILTGCVMCCQ